MAEVQYTNHSLVIISMNYCLTFLIGHIVCDVSCLNITLHLSALYVMLYIEQVCTYKLMECYIVNNLPILTA
jgi:hypothetical protein